MLNRAILMGRLTKDPEMRQTSNGVEVTTFTLAVNRNYSKAGNPQTDFIDIVAWRQTAKFAYQYFNKGQLVAVDGQIQTRTYTDRNGANRKAFEIVADQVYFAESKSASDQRADMQRTAPQNDTGFTEPEGDFAETPADDDLPF